jgi:hypothetical protein
MSLARVYKKSDWASEKLGDAMNAWVPREFQPKVVEIINKVLRATVDLAINTQRDEVTRFVQDGMTLEEAFDKYAEI